jgi:hypothetical protein
VTKIKELYKATASVAILVVPGLLSGQVKTCSAANRPGSYTYTNSDSTQHLLGNHSWTSTGQGQCSYSSVGAPGVVPCGVTCTATSLTSSQEYGVTVWDVLSLPWVHYVTTGSSFGVAQGVGGTQCASVAAVAVRSCFLLSGCAISIGFSGSGTGIGVSAGFSTTPLWEQQMPYTMNCQSVILQGCYPGGCGSSPIIVDTDGQGFHMSPPDVLFDFDGNGKPSLYSWTAKGSTNGWLALPGANGTVDSAKELFGNADGFANGFLKLATFDSNQDGQIDVQDAVWSQLRIWIDANHNGKSEPEELHTLDEIGIKSISLAYRESRRVDQYGDLFRYLGSLNPDHGDPVNRAIYDVFLVTK